MCSYRARACLLLQCESMRPMMGFALECLQLLLMLQLAPQSFLRCGKRTHLHNVTAVSCRCLEDAALESRRIPLLFSHPRH